jgi:hypothetical protein
MAGETYSIKGGASVRWGVNGVTTVGTCLTHSEKDDAKLEDVPNDMGAEVGCVIFDISKQVTFDVLAPTAGTRPTVGTVLTVDGVGGLLVTASEKKAGNKELTKWGITAKKAANTNYT